MLRALPFELEVDVLHHEILEQQKTFLHKELHKHSMLIAAKQAKQFALRLQAEILDECIEESIARIFNGMKQVQQLSVSFVNSIITSSLPLPSDLSFAAEQDPSTISTHKDALTNALADLMAQKTSGGNEFLRFAHRNPLVSLSKIRALQDEKEQMTAHLEEEASKKRGIFSRMLGHRKKAMKEERMWKQAQEEREVDGQHLQGLVPSRSEPNRHTSYLNRNCTLLSRADV